MKSVAAKSAVGQECGWQGAGSSARPLAASQLVTRATEKERGMGSVATWLTCRKASPIVRWGAAAIRAVVLLNLIGRPLSGAILVAKNGMLLEGQAGFISGISENPLVVNVPAGGVDVSQIVLLDDGLRRTYISWLQVNEDWRESDPASQQRIRVRQNVASGSRLVGSVSSILGIGPFDQWGRRTFSILTPRGQVDIVQGITEITPIYTKLEGLAGKPAVQWDCRIATSSVPRETLSQVIRLQGVDQGVDARLQVVRLMLAAERFNDARLELEQTLAEFPDLKRRSELEELLVRLRQSSANRLVDEIELRRKAGQLLRAEQLLNQFPSEGVAAETLLRVSGLLREHTEQKAQGDAIRQALRSLIEGMEDPTVRAQAEMAERELSAELNPNSLPRMADYQRFADDPAIPADGKLALLISGWVLGSGAATQNLAEALSVYRARDLVAAYLLTETDQQRAAILEQLGREEGGTPQRVAQILLNLKPPVATDPQPDRPPGSFLIQVPGVSSDETFAYEIQLPDEYDPARRYAAILTLHGGGRSPSDQIDWWAGPYDPQSQMRLGQAARHGYIVIAPHWSNESQRQYEYSGHEHARVLACLRDACRRFAVDTDRVFLSGHSLGGDAAWDLGLAHPDLWAGVIPIVATADHGPQSPKYVSLYWENARYVPWYFVIGELDGNKLELNRRDFDRYLKRSGYDVIVVEYIGRGHEHFYDEIHRLFSWMNLHRRNFAPSEFKCVTMRPFDNFFWYLELDDLPVRAMVSPWAWPAPSARPAEQEFRRTESGSLRIETGAEKARLWLSPDVVDLNANPAIVVNGQRRSYSVAPDVKTLLEDARTRADRQHPFWVSVELVTGKRASR
jgi:predicted esterase